MGNHLFSIIIGVLLILLAVQFKKIKTMDNFHYKYTVFIISAILPIIKKFINMNSNVSIYLFKGKSRRNEIILSRLVTKAHINILNKLNNNYIKTIGNYNNTYGIILNIDEIFNKSYKLHLLYTIKLINVLCKEVIHYKQYHNIESCDITKYNYSKRKERRVYKLSKRFIYHYILDCIGLYFKLNKTCEMIV